MDTALITILIPTYNRAKMLGDALESLIHQETDDLFSYEIVVVDNASTDSTKEVVDETARRAPVPVTYVFEEEEGVAQARNRGLDHAKGAWIAFIDDDECAGPDWLKELYKVAVDTGAPCVGGAVHLDLPESQLRRLSPICRTTILRERNEFSCGSQVRPFRRREFPGTDNELIARHVFDTVGQFDTSMLRGGSDNDFSTRVRRAGYAMWYAPGAVVNHRVPPNRLTPEFFRFSELKTGAGLAFLDHRYRGLSKMLLLGLARTGQAFLLIMPRLCYWRLRRHPVETLGQKCLWWRFTGYIRQGLALLAPRVLAQQAFLDSIEFRKGLTVGRRK